MRTVSVIDNSPRRIFVSSRFQRGGYSTFLTQLLGSLRCQELDPVIYRGVRGRIPAGAHIREHNRKDIASASAFLALVSPDYVASRACRWEAEAAAEENASRALPLLVAYWPGMSPDLASWPALLRALLGNSNQAAQDTMVFPIPTDPGVEDADRLCRDVCCRLDLPFRSEVDPLSEANELPLIARTRQLVRVFPPNDTTRVDGDVADLLRELARHHRRAARRPRDNAALKEDLALIREDAGGGLTDASLSFLMLGEAVYAFLSAQRTIGADQSSALDRVEALATSARELGDPPTQRDASVLLGNVALYRAAFERALEQHATASRIAQLMESRQVRADDRWEATRHLLSGIAGDVALCQTGPNAYQLFDNLLRARIRCLRLPAISELRQRVAEWEQGIEYAHPSHHERYAALLAFALALAGDMLGASSVIEKLEDQEDRDTRLHLATWHSLLQILNGGLAGGLQQMPSTLVDGLDWIVGMLEQQQAGDTPALALCHVEIGFLMQVLGRGTEQIAALTRALSIHPDCTRLRIERAVAQLRAGWDDAARTDCIATIASPANAEKTYAPFGERCQPAENQFAHGLAYWLLGELKLAILAHRESGEASFYESYFPSEWAGVLRPTRFDGEGRA